MKQKTFLVTGILLALVCSSASLMGGSELIVIGNNGPGRPMVLRLDAQTGAVLNRYEAAQEGLQGVAVDAKGGVLLAGNTLGYGEITRLLDSKSAPAMAHPALIMPGSLRVGPDGNVYVISTSGENGEQTARILRFESSTGKFLGGFYGNSDTGNAWTDLAFGPDGTLFVTDHRLGVMHFNAQTGDFLGAFVPAGPGGPRTASALAFGPDGNLYVADRDADTVLRFDGKTGQPIDTFVKPESGGMKSPVSLAFDAAGQLYVSSSTGHSILRFDGKTGEFSGTIIGGNTLRSPSKLVFASIP
jgi:sugar lactone lactonase YvrE